MTNKRIINTFDISVDKPKIEIFKAIKERKKKSNWSDLLFEPNINFREIEISDNQIDITIKPNILSGNRPYGEIIIDVCENEDGKSQLSGKILISKNRLLVQIIFAAVLVSIWSVVSVISPNGNSILMSLEVLFVFELIIFLNYKYNNWKLIDYSKKIIMELKKNTKAVHQ